jgi:hypothetical protein
VSGELYRLTGDWISPAPWFATHDFEGSKTDYVNTLALLKVALD